MQQKKTEKFISLLLCLFIFTNPCFAFWGKQDKNDVQKLDVRINYTNQDFIARFDDPLLQSYVIEALKNNNNIRKTAWLVEEYRQQVKYSLGKEFPSLSGGANYLGLHLPGITTGARTLIKQNSFVVPFLMSYEADFLLKNRDKTRSANKNYEAEEYQEKAVNIALVTDVSTAYTNIMQYDELINLQCCIVDVKKIQMIVAQKSYNAGVMNLDDLNNAKKEFETSKQNLDSFIKDRENLLHSFLFLLGRSPANINDIKRNSIQKFEYNYNIPNCISSEVTFARPDVLAAEAKLAAAKFDVNVARKELFPRFNILGLWVFTTDGPGNFFGWDSTVAAILAGATQDIFKGGMKIANLKINKSRYEQMFEDYKQAELTAVKEINDALCIVKYDTQIDKSSQKKLELQTVDYRNAKKKYTDGTLSYPKLLDEQEKFLMLSQDKVQAKTARIVNYFTLYKAVGGAI